jgi:hypothetical protein
MVAKTINIFPAGMIGRIRNGQFPMGDSGNTMTNAEVVQFTAGVSGRILKMKITEGISEIFVPEGIPIMRMVTMKQSDLKKNIPVRVRSHDQSDGTAVADSIDIDITR